MLEMVKTSPRGPSGSVTVLSHHLHPTEIPVGRPRVHKPQEGHRRIVDGDLDGHEPGRHEHPWEPMEGLRGWEGAWEWGHAQPCIEGFWFRLP